MRVTFLSPDDGREVELEELPWPSSLKSIVLPDLRLVDEVDLRRAHAFVCDRVSQSSGTDRMIIGVLVLRPIEQEMQRRGMQADFWSREHRLRRDRSLEQRLQHASPVTTGETDDRETKEAATESECSPEELGRVLARGWSELEQEWRDEFLLGVGSERRRLAQNPFLVAVKVSEFDYDGLMQYVFLEASFDTAEEADTAAEAFFEELQQGQAGGTHSDYFGRGAEWRYEGEKASPYDPEALSTSGPHELSSRTFKVRASDFETKYFTVRVLGPFEGEPVDRALIDLVGPDLFEYFTDLGRAMRRGGRRPRAGDDR